MKISLKNVTTISSYTGVLPLKGREILKSILSYAEDSSLFAGSGAIISL
jgi:hypothetical protein